MKNLIALTFLCLFNGSLYAQANEFEGATVGINLNLVGASVNATAFGNSVNYGQSTAVPAVEIGYNIGVSDKIVLGLTGTYDLGKTNFGNEYQMQMENHYSINFKPGFVVAKNALVYGVVGYNGGTAKLPYSDINPTRALSGIGYGVGTALSLEKNIFIKIEVQKVEYANQSNWNGFDSFNPSSTIGTVGVGYRF